jgi:hypothetical protein
MVAIVPASPDNDGAGSALVIRSRLRGGLADGICRNTVETTMSKQQLINFIQRHNPTAGADFLATFDEAALHSYLNHLHFGKRPRTAGAQWVRGTETPAVVTRVR